MVIYKRHQLKLRIALQRNIPSVFWRFSDVKKELSNSIWSVSVKRYVCKGSLWPQRRRVWERRLPSGSQAVSVPFRVLNSLTDLILKDTWPSKPACLARRDQGNDLGNPQLLDPHYPAAPRVYRGPGLYLHLSSLIGRWLRRWLSNAML